MCLLLLNEIFGFDDDKTETFMLSCISHYLYYFNLLESHAVGVESRKTMHIDEKALMKCIPEIQLQLYRNS